MTQAIVIFTWAAWVMAFAGLGYLPARMLGRHIRGSDRVRAGLWLGLSLVIALVLVANLVMPLGGSTGVVLQSALLGAGIVVITLLAYQGRNAIRTGVAALFTPARVPMFLYFILLGVGVVVAANFATAEPMDADAGGYRIGAVLYTADARTIPGLAHLHFRFGFNSSMWPFGGFVGNGIWSGQGWRLVTGVFLAVLVADNVLRLGARRPPTVRAGDWYVVVATAFTGAVILTDSGRWVPSPAQDVTFLVACIASTGLLVDFIGRPILRVWAGSLAIVTASVAGSIRPLGWGLAAVTAGVVMSRLWMARRTSVRSRRKPTWRSLAPAVGISALLFMLMLLRDAILSGWLLYPLAAFPLPVDWRVGDPTNVSRWITSWGRAPGQDADLVLASTNWVTPWLANFWSLRETSLLRWVALGSLLPLLWPRGRAAWRVSWRPLTWVLIPSVVLAAAWFITAPDIRFGWGFVLNIAALPFSFVVAAGAFPWAGLRVTGVLLLIAMMGAALINGRLATRGKERVAVPTQVGPWTVELHLAPPATVPPSPGRLKDGTKVLYPSLGNNCWDLFPLCLLPGSGNDVVRRGADWREGFRTSR